MKKFLTMLTALFVFAAVPVYAANNPITSFFERFYTFNSDVNTKVALLQKRNAEQQKKYEAKKAEQEKKILEQQRKRQEVYAANQKRLEQKREQLRKLLEE